MHFLKKINIYIDKLKKLSTILINAKIIFQNPIKKKIIIFDLRSSNELSQILEKKNIFFLANRIEEIKEIYVTKEIILFLIKNIFKRSIKINYLLKLIIIIDPKIIITRTDTSKDFHILSKILYKKIKCISLQQGSRFLLGKNPLGDDSPASVIKKYFIPEFFVFSKFDKKNFTKIKTPVKKYHIVGSIRSALALKYFKHNKINIQNEYDFCLISDPHEYSTTGLISKYLIKLCNEEKLTYVIAARSNLYDGRELLYYNQFCNIKKINIKKNRLNSYSSYFYMLKSKITIGQYSTLLFEALSLKKKVVTIHGILNNFVNLDIFSRNLNSNDTDWKENKKSYDLFKKLILEIYTMKKREYFSLFKNSDYFMPSNINTVKIIREKVNKLLRNRKMYKKNKF